jgi:GNAT superfamily N-acetyltransferase
MEIKISHFSVENPLYQECLNIRYEVLRKPLGMDIKPEEKESDKRATHILAQVDGRAVGTVSLIDNRLRQMAVIDGQQGLGIGAELVRHLEKVAKGQGVREVILDARFNAIPFYEKLGYECCSGIYDKIGLKHRDMKKAL